MAVRKKANSRIETLPDGLVGKILGFLDDLKQIIRFSGCSTECKQLVTVSGITKELFMREVDLGVDTVWENPPYALLTKIVEIGRPRDLIIEALMASSTASDVSPIQNTLNSSKYVQWSSIGRETEDLRETLTYKLPEVCFVHQIIIHLLRWAPLNLPTFKARRARISFGNGNEDGTGFTETYTTVIHSFPKHACLRVVLPKPVLCINKHMQIELLDAVNKHKVTGLYYIRVSRVKVEGFRFEEFFRTRRTSQGQLVVEASYVRTNNRALAELMSVEEEDFSFDFLS